MNWSDIIAEALKESNMTKSALASKMGYARPSSITDALACKRGIRIDSFVKMLDAMDYDVVVKYRHGKRPERKVDAE